MSYQLSLNICSVKNLELRDFLLPEDIPVLPSNQSSNQSKVPIDEELLNPDNVSSKLDSFYFYFS